MPVRTIGEQISADEQRLQAELLQEWRQPTSDPDAPVILLERNPFRPTVQPQHIYVVWSAWARLSQQERSRLILESYKQIATQEIVNEVTVAMGLTPEEADRLGISYTGE